MGYEQSKNLGMFDAYIDLENIYFSNNTFNALMCFNKEKKICTYLGSFEGDALWAKGLHKKVERYHEKLFFFPNNANGVSTYDITTGEISFFACEEYLEVAEVIIFGKFACMVPKSLNQAFYLFDMEEFCYIKKKNWNKVIRDTLGNIDVNFLNASVTKNTIWVIGAFKNFLVEISLESEECKIYYLREEDQACGITSDEEHVWVFLYQNQTVVQWDKEKGDLQSFSLLQYSKPSDKKEVYYLYYIKQNLFLLPFESGQLFVIDTWNEIRRIKIPQRNRVKDAVRKKLPLSFRCVADENDIYILPYASDKLYRYNIKAGQVMWFELIFKNKLSYYKEIACVHKMWTKENRFITEKTEGYNKGEWKNILLEEFVDIVENDFYIKIEGEHFENQYGDVLYEYVKNNFRKR